jgi:hypothetical protein
VPGVGGSTDHRFLISPSSAAEQLAKTAQRDQRLAGMVEVDFNVPPAYGFVRMLVLASFCNLRPPREESLASINLEDGSIEARRHPIPSAIDTCTGLASSSGRIYSLSASRGVHLLSVWPKDGPPTYQPLEGILDAHSILIRGGYLYVVSTGTDEVVRYRLENDQPTDREVAWRASSSSSDTHHLNSIAEFRGSLVVSGFGPKAGTLWSSATDGYIWDIERDMPILRDIYHPHSVACRGDQLLFCESSTSRLCSLRGVVAQLHGYTRGMVWLSERLVCVASSVGRKISKSTGLIANAADPGELIGHCQLVVVDVVTGQPRRTIDLSSFGDEIYDLLALPDQGA